MRHCPSAPLGDSLVPWGSGLNILFWIDAQAVSSRPCNRVSIIFRPVQAAARQQRGLRYPILCRRPSWAAQARGAARRRAAPANVAPRAVRVRLGVPARRRSVRLAPRVACRPVVAGGRDAAADDAGAPAAATGFSGPAAAVLELPAPAQRPQSRAASDEYVRRGGSAHC